MLIWIEADAKGKMPEAQRTHTDVSISWKWVLFLFCRGCLDPGGLLHTSNRTRVTVVGRRNVIILLKHEGGGLGFCFLLEERGWSMSGEDRNSRDSAAAAGVLMAATVDIGQPKVRHAHEKEPEKLRNVPSTGQDLRRDLSSRSFCAFGTSKQQNT